MSVDQDKLDEILKTLEAAEQLQKYRAKDFFVPYAKQAEFCKLGATTRERLLMAGNRVGKTQIGAYECVAHLTGEYPAWWEGKRFDRPVEAWAAGVTGLSTRDVVQEKLCGKPGVESRFGTGMIPREAFVGKPSTARGVSDLYDTIVVKHKSGGDSVLVLKTYEQGREKWQGATLDFVWFDEEPPQEIYSEGVARLKEGGMTYMTFTPMEGMSDVVMSFVESDEQGAPKLREKDDKGVPVTGKGLVMMTLDDVTHFSAADKALRIASYKDYEREARVRGIPILGGGRIFQVMEEMITETAFSYYPPHWVWLWGIDFGIDHPFAAVLIAWDRDADVIHVVHTIRMKDATYLQHAAAMKPFGGIKVAWPQDGTQRDRGDLKPYSNHYSKQGLLMLPKHAMFSDGSNSTEAGIAEMDERFKSGRLKVAKHLADWFEEFRLYHRKDGLIVKKRDDIMSATRVAVMAKRFAAPRRHFTPPGSGARQTMAEGVDDSPW